MVRLAPSDVCDGNLVVVVFVEVVKELFCKTAKEDRTEEALETRFVLLHQTVTAVLLTSKPSKIIFRALTTFTS